MENEKKEYKPNSFLAPNKVVAILIFALIILVIGALITYLVAAIYSATTSVSYNEIKASFSLKSEEFSGLSSEVLKANAVCQGFGNLIAYLLATIGVVFFTRDEVVNDFLKLKVRGKFYLWYIPLTSIIFVAAGFGIDKLVALGTTASENQQQIVNIFQNGGMVPMIISTLLLAPVVEELVYRKCIFSLCGKRIVLAYIASIVLFTMPHMLTTSASFGDWALKAIPYITSGAMLAAIYHLSGFNVYTSIVAHILNNLLAIILVFI